MNFKTTYFLFGALVAMLVLFAIGQFTGLKQDRDKSSYVLPTLNQAKNPMKAEDIESVEIARTKPTEEKLVFYRTENGWMSKNPPVRLDSYLVDRLVDQVRGARKEEKADLTSNLSQFGLDKPGTTVTLTKKGDSKEHKLHIGDEGLGGEKAVVYVASSDRNLPMAVRKSTLDNAFKTLADFRSKDLLGANSTNTSQVSLQETGKDALTLEKGVDNRWRFQKPAFGEAEYEGEVSTTPSPKEQKGITGVRELLDGIGGLKVSQAEDFVAEEVSPADLAGKYGLEKDKPAKLRIEVKRSAGGFPSPEEKKEPVTEALLIGKKDEKNDDKYYARLENEGVVVKIPAKTVNDLIKVIEQPAILRNRDLAQVDTSKVDAINIKNEGGQLKLRKTGQPEAWKLYAGGKPRGAESTAVQDLLAALTAKRQVKDFPPASRPDAELGLDKPVAEIALFADAVAKDEEKKEEKTDEKKDEKAAAKPDPDAEPKLKTDKPKVRLLFGKKEGDVVFVRREEGEDKARLAVPATLFEKVNSGALAYMDRTLPTFQNESDITKVALLRNGQTFELAAERKDEKSPATWKFTTPKELAGRSADPKAVEELIGDLRRLTAEKLLVEKATDNDLEKYGLKSPSLKVTITSKKGDKTEDMVYSFGKESEDKSLRFAKQSERDVVFQVRTPALTGLQAELLDPTVLRFDPAKVKGIKLQGWEKLYNFTLHLDFERKSGDMKGWTVKTGPSGFQLDEKKLDALVSDLSHLRAERYVSHGSAPKPEQKLGKTDRSLEIEITVEGEKAPLTLTLGALDPADKKAYFAQSSMVPGDVFLVPQPRFQKLLDEGGGKYLTKEMAAFLGAASSELVRLASAR